MNRQVETPESLRKALGLSGAELARRANVDRTVVDRIEGGSFGRYQTLRAVAEVLGVRLGRLVDAIENVREQKGAA